MINIAAPEIEQEEIDAVVAVMKTGGLAQGPKVAELEEKFAAYVGAKEAVALNSGTAAIHCALHAAGVGAGDEVITTPFSFIATINPILMQGAIPKLADIQDEGFNIDPAAVEKVVTDKTKAIIGVDLYGQPYDYDQLKQIADDHKLTLIEDACQAIGASYGDKKAGVLGDVAAFSLYATKNIMSGEGGVMTTNNPEFAAAARRFRQHGMSSQYEYAELGYNYRITDLLAAIATVQLGKVDEFTEARQRNAKIFDEGLKGLAGIVTPTIKDGRTHVYHQYTIRLKPELGISREDFVAKLREQGVGSGVYYPKPLHFYPHIAALGYKEGDFPNAEAAAREVVSLPVHPKVSEADAKHIVNVIREIAHA